MDDKKCPWCAEFIKAEARVCKHCGRDFPSAENRKALVGCITVPIMLILLFGGFLAWAYFQDESDSARMTADIEHKKGKSFVFTKETLAAIDINAFNGFIDILRKAKPSDEEMRGVVGTYLVSYPAGYHFKVLGQELGGRAVHIAVQEDLEHLDDWIAYESFVSKSVPETRP